MTSKSSKSKPKLDLKSESKSKPKYRPHLSSNKSLPPPSSSSPPIHSPKGPKLSSTPNLKSVATSSSASRKCVKKELEEDDNLVIINALLHFKNQYGSTPTPTTTPPIVNDVNSSLHHRLTTVQLYNKFRSLKRKYNRMEARGLKRAWVEEGSSMEAWKVGMKFADRKEVRKLDLKWKRLFVDFLEIKRLGCQLVHQAVEVAVAGLKGEEES